MLRKLGAGAVAALLIAGVGWTATASGEPSAEARGVYRVPAPGSYQGMDHHGRQVSFVFTGQHITGFKVDQQPIGSGGFFLEGWTETCDGAGWCSGGSWQTNTHVVGRWRNPTGVWTAWSADLPGQSRGYQGQYSGTDHYDHEVRFVRSGHRVVHFNVAGRSVGSAVVAQGAWPETCNAGSCFKGHWLDDDHVVGSWRQEGGHWVAWEARPAFRR
jgi:hypothetical protein